LQSGFHGVRADLVHAVPYLELGLAQQLVIGLGHEQTRNLEHFFPGADHNPIG
jgi:hypothetical protein